MAEVQGMSELLSLDDDTDPPNLVDSADLQGIATMLKKLNEGNVLTRRHQPDSNFNGEIECFVDSTLLGWITAIDDGDWVWVPCIPQRHWSKIQKKWVDLATIRAENAVVPLVPVVSTGS